MTRVLLATRRLVTGLTNLTWVTAGYGWFTLVAPILVAAPLYFAGKMSFGGLMMAAGAFTQVQSSLRWFVDNFSTHRRLARDPAAGRELPPRGASTPTCCTTSRAASPSSRASRARFGIDDLEIASPAGCTMLEETHVADEGRRARPDRRRGRNRQDPAVPRAGGSVAVGRGPHRAPNGEAMLYMPRTPYLPPGTLREVLAYPSTVANFAAEAFAHALERLGLERLVPLLDQSRRWDQDLSEDEQQTLAFARALLHAPAVAAHR